MSRNGLSMGRSLREKGTAHSAIKQIREANSLPRKVRAPPAITATDVTIIIKDQKRVSNWDRESLERM